ncbi:MAG TPA: hypothetical protein VFK69_10675 [Candidatus Eisenbacteria bacterium]|nr:hypothetical protein [Candidatus Eisenbacteria bacterium]
MAILRALNVCAWSGAGTRTAAASAASINLCMGFGSCPPARRGAGLA